MKHLIETPRLKLRMLSKLDADNIVEILGNEKTMQYILGSPADKNLALEKLETWLKYNEKYNDLGVYGIIEKEQNKFIGYGVARHVDFLNGTDHHDYEIGYAFYPEFWGKGLATEIVPYICKYLFEKLPVDKLHAFTDTENFISMKVLEKNGFALKGFRDIYGGSNEYYIHREDFFKNYL